MKSAFKGRMGSSDTCYNRRRINDLGRLAGSVKKDHFFHRYSQGNKVKSFVPVSE
jgi:hypothetical protein